MPTASAGLSALRWGVAVARRAWLTPADVLNTRSVREFTGALRSATQPDTTTMSAEKIAEIRKLYFEATPKTIQRDIERAIDLLKILKDDEERGKAAVFMEGLNEMRKEWKKPVGAAREPPWSRPSLSLSIFFASSRRPSLALRSVASLFRSFSFSRCTNDIASAGGVFGCLHRPRMMP